MMCLIPTLCDGALAPPTGVDEKMWEEAMRKAAVLAKQEGRDAFEVLPLPVYSFADLKKRVQIQEETRKEDDKHLRHLKEMVSQIVNKQGQLMKELKARANTHIDLARRVMRIYRKQGLREFDSAKDQELRRRITALDRELTDPSRCIGRLQDMIAKVDMQDQADDDNADDAHMDAAQGCSIATPSDATLHKLMDHLSNKLRLSQRGRS
eukprot:m.620407 g.620407  ORF g.620407 m.620407 type:complete len:209 (-) comp22536_c0_seq3:1111-1737(-)